MNLTGKVAIVTGAGRGIGRGEARALAAEGATVVVNDRGGDWDGTGEDNRPAQQVVDEIVADGGTAVADFSDVADWNEGSQLVNSTVEQFGRLDILTCNAGILRDRMLFNLNEEEWDTVIRVNLKGNFVPLRAAALHWRAESKRTGGPVNAAVVLTSSGSGLYSNAGQANYAAAKAGVAALSIVASRELGAYGVRVNCVSPSARTRLTEKSFENDPRNTEGQTFDALHPDNVAPWVVYLCTDAAQGVTGQVFGVRAGIVELVEGWRPVSTIQQDHRWTQKELAEQAPSLFGDRPTGPPAMRVSSVN